MLFRSFVVGGAETPAFLAQNRAMAAAWAKAGARAEVVEAAGEDHFSLIARLADPASDLTGRVVRFLDEVVPAGA